MVVQSVEVLRKGVGGCLSSRETARTDETSCFGMIVVSPEGRKTLREALSQTLDSVSSENEGHYHASFQRGLREAG